MGKYHQARHSLNDLLQTQLQHEFEANGHPITDHLRQVLGDKAESLLDEFEGHASEHSLSHCWRGIWQSFWDSVIFALAIGIMALVIYSSRQEAWKILGGRGSNEESARSTQPPPGK